MKPVKRIEIVVDSLVVPKVKEALASAGLRAWTVVRHVSGQGDRGVRSSDDLAGVSSNDLVIAACEPAELDAVIAAIRPVLKLHGGVCLVSDARWVLH